MPDSMNAILIKCPENNTNKSCETQLIVNIHMNPSFDLENTEKFWVVDKVFDPSKGITSKIISPYLIVVSRGEPVVMYPLRFIKSINNEKISMKPLKEVNNNAKLGGSPSCMTNEGQLETNIKGQEMENATRLKRNHFPLYATGKSIISSIFGTKRHKKNIPSRRRDKRINDLQQKDLSSLGLVQVLDTAVTKNYLDSPNNFLNSYKDTQSKELDKHNLLKWHDHYIPKSNSEVFSRKSQMNTQHKENLKSLNIADDADKLFSYENSRNRQQQNNEGKLYTEYEKSEEESVPDYLLYERLAQESRRKKIKENFDKNYVPPRKSMYNSNEFSNREDHESIEYKLPPKSLNDVQGFPYESVENHFPNQKRLSHKMENENYNLITSGDRKTNTYEFPIKRDNNNLRSHSIGDVYDFPHGSKKHHENYKPLLEDNYVAQERKYKKKNFRGYNSQYNKHDFSLEAEKDLYYSRTPVESLSRDMDFPSEIENKKNNFKNPTYSYSDSNGFSHGNPYDNSLSKEKDFESGNENLNLNAPKGNLYSHNFNFDTKLEYPRLPENNVNDFPWTQSNIGDESLDSIVNRHMKQKLPGDFNAPNDLNLDYFKPASSQKYLDFGSKQNINPYLTYSKTNSYETLPYPRSRNLKRMKRDGLQDRHMENGEDSRLDPKYDADLDSLKVLKLKHIDDNGEIPCDTCGGKNKKKDEKPRTIYSSALAEPKSLEGKIENANPKIDEAVPCDTCGGKNKKPGGKPLPGGLPPEVNSLDAESDERRLPDYMIPCESCKTSNRYTEGNLESASCGCVTNSKVCNCESSKLSRALNDSLKEWSYTVFNMNNPVPFLSTKLRVFRRRHNTWWLVVPIVTLDSVSGIFANDNFSAVLTSHIDMIRLEKSTGFSNRNLAVPKENEKAFARKRHAITLKDLQNNIGNSVLLDESNKDVSIREIKNSCNLKVQNEESMKGLASRSIKGLGYLPVSMNALDNCPHKDKTLCLNIREDKVPEFSIKVKIPFRENALVMRNQHMVKISRIITDATTKDALQISIDVINKGFEAQEYTIFVCNCDILKSGSASHTARRLLQPDIGQTVTFLVPLIIVSKKNKKYSCDVMVKASTDYDESDTNLPKPVDPKVGVIAKRTMEIKCHSRCFCVWRCRCHCIGKLETFINYNACERMDPKSEKEAGLVYNCPPGNEPNDVCIKDVCSDRKEEITCKLTCKVIAITLLVLMLLFLLGLLKAILGICITCIGRCGFDTVQPGRTYECTSCIRIFLVNCFFFIIYPFACWCKCFRPKARDLIEASSDWDCISQNDETQKCTCDKNESSCRLHGGQDLQNNLVLAFAPLHENGLFKDEKSDDEESHLFILEVLEESKSSLTKMMSQVMDPVQNVEQATESNADVMAAEEFVECLRNSQVAYRTLSSPVGGVVNIPDNFQYCVKGFFVQTINSNFEFMSYHPLSQFVGITEENEVRALAQPRYIHSNEFSRVYADKMEVHKAADLSVVPPMDVPCINIDHGNQLEGSFVKLAAQQEKMKANQT
ncbi:uncharacterized protein LOC6555487 [Drosophila erecta]|uniref:uncharacterized protein LOC6555487 n=1 Tax=Drosophila erecta TaxID=7220 RepID=UPI000732A5B1|nr:uncharacterized protein LOC6555487 [Drosophila erecta]EDV53740.2 uncharacterized protein Dere_GG12289 [Drosophila erecta]